MRYRTRAIRPQAKYSVQICAACGFSLIELLVVVAIIALLVSIMVPALGQARSQAKIIQCLANQRSIAQAMCLYLNSFDGYLPGSPNTSGIGPRRSPPQITLATNTFDYASPLLDFMNMAAPANRAARQEVTRLGPFKCPANVHRADPWTGGQSVPDAASFSATQAASYLTCWNFLLAGDGYVGAQVAPGVPYWLSRIPS